MATMKEDEYKSMKLFKAKITQFNINNKESIRKEFPLVDFAKNSRDSEIVAKHLSYHLSYYQSHKEFLVSNINDELIKDAVLVGNKTMTIKAVPGISKKIGRLSEIAKVEEIYSDWTSQLIGWQINLNDRQKIIFQQNKDDILTNLKEPIVIEESPILEKLIQSNLVYLVD